MSAVQQLNQNAEIYRKDMALAMNMNAAHATADLLRSNLGPHGTIKMLVGGSGDAQLTKDGGMLLKNLTIVHPTAMLIARAAVGQDEQTGDGTTSMILLIDGILKNSERRLSEGIHPRILTQGIEEGRDELLRFLTNFARDRGSAPNSDILLEVAESSIRTKLPADIASHLAEIVRDAVVTIGTPGKGADLLMVEQLGMLTRMANDTILVKGLVLDHGLRHDRMKTDLRNCFILPLNVSLEFENTEVTTSFAAKTVEERERMAIAERKFVEDKVAAIVKFKQAICTDGQDFLVVNMKGIDGPSLEALADAGISAVRRAKRRNMERLSKACGGKETNSVESLTRANVGFAGHVWENILGEEHFMFIDELKEPKSVTILVRGSNAQSIRQQQDAIRDGLRAVNNALRDEVVLPGGGEFEMAAWKHLHDYTKTLATSKRLGVEALADSFLEIVRTLALNSGLDPITSLVSVQAAVEHGKPAGLSLDTGKAIDAGAAGIWDNLAVKRQMISGAPMVASQLLLVDEVLKAAKNVGGG